MRLPPSAGRDLQLDLCICTHLTERHTTISTARRRIAAYQPAAVCLQRAVSRVPLARAQVQPNAQVQECLKVEPTAAENFLDFLRVIPDRMRALIEIVELYSGVLGEHDVDRSKCDGLGDTKYALFHLADMCRYHPHITVRYRIWALDSAKFVDNFRPYIIYVGVCFTSLLRNEEDEEIWAPAQTHYERRLSWKDLADWDDYDVAGRGLGQIGVMRLRAPNLRFFPMDTDLESVSFEPRGRYLGSETGSYVGLERFVGAVAG